MMSNLRRIPGLRFAKYFLNAFILILFGVFLIRYRGEFYILREITGGQVFQLFLLTSLGIAISGFKLNWITRSFGFRLNPREWFGLSSITITLNNILFKSGSLVTSNYLKRNHGFPYMSFVGALAGDQLILLFISAAAGAGVCAWLTVVTPADLTAMAGLYVSMACGLFLFMRGTFRFKNRKHFLIQAALRAWEAFQQILKNRPLFWILCAHGIAMLITITLRFYVACTVLQLEIPLAYCFLFTTVMVFVRLLPLTPGDIGTRELAVGWVSALVGIGLTPGLLATVVDRVFEMFWSLLFSAGFKNILLSPKLTGQGT